mgnify:CR=1 FL=1
MTVKHVDEQFGMGDLVYYRGFEIFPREAPRKHMGIIIGIPDGMPHIDSYLIYWFESELTGRIHYDMIELVHDRKR